MFTKGVKAIMNKTQQVLFESLVMYGVMNDEPCKLKFDKNGNPSINVASLYPSVFVNIDKSRIINQYKTEEGWVIEI